VRDCLGPKVREKKGKKGKEEKKSMFSHWPKDARDWRSSVYGSSARGCTKLAIRKARKKDTIERGIPKPVTTLKVRDSGSQPYKKSKEKSVWGPKCWKRLKRGGGPPTFGGGGGGGVLGEPLERRHRGKTFVYAQNMVINGGSVGGRGSYS